MQSFELISRPRRTSLLLFALCLPACTLEPLEIPPPAPLDVVTNPLAYVDPRIGSGGFGYAFGSAFPGAAAPFGLAKVGPDTRGDDFDTITFLHYSGYWAEDEYIQGFSHLHLHGTGATDYGVLSVMPLGSFDPTRPTVVENESHFDKATEVATPGYYGVTLDRGAIRVEIAATTHGAHHRYTYPESATEGHILFDLNKHLNDGNITQAQVQLFPDEHRIVGKLHHDGGMSDGFGGYDVHFDAITRKPWKKALLFANGSTPAELLNVEGDDVGFDLAFDVTGGDALEMQIGISFNSTEHAAANRLAELPEWDFAATNQKTVLSWLDLLQRITIAGGSEADRRMFYSSLYRSFLMPTQSSDVDGTYRFGGQTGTASGYRFLTDQSLWDTYRTLTPFYALVAPEASLDTVKSLHAMAKIIGFFPKWPIATGEAGTMLGSSADVVVGDAYIKGIDDFDVDGAYAILRAAALDEVDPPGGRGGRQWAVAYNENGYVPANIGRSASHTLEYGANDLALANLARAIGKTEDAAIFDEHSLYHRNLFDPVTGFIRAKDENGMFVENPYNPYSLTDHYAEANGWHSLWAQQDIVGIAELLGGQTAFVDKLTQFFEEGVADLEERPIEDRFASGAPRFAYWHGNEPCIHAAYGFAQVGRADLTQKYVRWVQRIHYNDTPSGLPGNDDGGTMSAWYMFTSAGFYPIAGTTRYILGAPLFPRMSIKVAGGYLIVDAPNVSAQNIYVKSVTWNGVPLDKPEISHDEISKGGTLFFDMISSPGSFGVTSP